MEATTTSVDALDEQVKRAQNMLSNTANSTMSAMTGLREDTVAMLTSRSKGLLDLATSITTSREQEPHKGAAREKASLEKHHATAKTVEQVLTPRLMELLSSREHTPPDPAEIAAGHSSRESLQATLGAASMRLAAEAKAETLHAELSEARGDLAYTLGSSGELVQAHARCVNDYAALKAVVERAREDAEALGRALQREGKVWGGGSGGGVGSAGVSTATKRLCTTLLETVGSSMTLNEAAGPGVEDASSSSSSLGGANESAGAAKSATTATGGEAAAGSGASPVPSAAERLRRQLEEAEAHQRSVAAQLHSRESQLALVRQELLNAEGERGRYADIISDASAKLAQAAGTPGDRTSRSVARRSEEADRLCEEEEKGLDEILSLCTRAATEWHAAENVHDAPPLADGFLVRGGAGGGGNHNIGNEENVSGGGQQLQLQASSKKEREHHHQGIIGSSSSSKHRRLARQAAVREVQRVTNLAKAKAKALRGRRAELSGIGKKSILPLPILPLRSPPAPSSPSPSRSLSLSTFLWLIIPWPCPFAPGARARAARTLREMLTALELERAARIRLQELLAKDWTAQANSLKTCFHEQDVVLEVRGRLLHQQTCARGHKWGAWSLLPSGSFNPLVSQPPVCSLLPYPSSSVLPPRLPTRRSGTSQAGGAWGRGHGVGARLSDAKPAQAHGRPAGSGEGRGGAARGSHQGARECPQWRRRPWQSRWRNRNREWGGGSAA